MKSRQRVADVDGASSQSLEFRALDDHKLLSAKFQDLKSF